MNFDLSRALEAAAAAESELTRLKHVLFHMQSVVQHQTNPRLHALTCGVDSTHPPLFPFWTGEKIVLRCAGCDYSQDYVPSCVATAPAAPAVDLDAADTDAGC